MFKTIKQKWVKDENTEVGDSSSSVKLTSGQFQPPGSGFNYDRSIAREGG